MRSSHPSISIVIPARNEARNLTALLPELPSVHEVLLIDGNSVDDTVAAARRSLPTIKVVRQTRSGKGNALACGFLAASGDVIVMLDADGSANPAEIPVFVEALVAGADFAKGSRFLQGGGSSDITALRRMGNDSLCQIANAMFGTRFSDLCYGYNAFWRDIVPVLDLPAVDVPSSKGHFIWGDGFEIEALLACRIAVAGLKIAEVPSFERQRVHGESNLRTFVDGARVLRTILFERGRSRREHRAGRLNERRRCFLPPRIDLLIHKLRGDGADLWQEDA